VHAHPRNKRDEELRALADKGGVIGIYMMPFLCESTRQPTLDDYMRHMVHALSVCGEDHVGIGTDISPFEVTEDALPRSPPDQPPHRRRNRAVATTHRIRVPIRT
jgi:membrane dipeptidase